MNEAAFQRVLRNYLYPYRIGKTAEDLLQEFIDIDVNGDDLVRILGNNPVYLHLLDEFVALKSGELKKQGDEEKIELQPTRRLLSLLGMVGSRNAILSLRLARATQGTFPYSKEGKLELKPDQYLKNALAIEELCQRNQIEYADSAFAGAYLFDWLVAVLKVKKAPQKALEYAAQAGRDAQRMALVALGISRLVQGFGFHRYAMAAALSVGLGKILMACEFDKQGNSFVAFQAETAKDPPPAVMATAHEAAAFGTHHSELAALCLSFSAILRPVERSVRHHLEPYYLRGAPKNVYLLGLVLHTAALMARNWRLPGDLKDPLVATWRSPWRAPLKVSDQQLLNVMQWAMKVN